MKQKEKPCKGTGKAKGYGCGKMQLERTYGLGHQCGCYPEWLFSSDEGMEKVKRATLKATKPRKDIEEAIKQKKERASLQYLKTNTTAVCHQYIRQRDKGKPCISCETPWHSNFHAGHFYKSELYSTLKYNEFNLQGQCPQCNLRKDGNVNQYSINLPKRIGQEKYDELVRLAEKDKQIDFKWDREELSEIRNCYRKKLKELKNN